MSSNFRGIVLVTFVASVIGLVISFSLIKEDVLSTAHTLFEYFPIHFGVTPASTWEGAMRLGLFISVTQIVCASVAFQRSYSTSWRIVAGVILFLSVPFDAWTDIVYRSGNFTGNLVVATVTTIAFYTFGSEIMQTLSWIVVAMTWRQGVREAMWATTKFFEGVKSISGEWYILARTASSQEARSVTAESAKFGATPAQQQSFRRPPPGVGQLATPTQSYRPAPKPVSTYQSGAQEPTYHPVGMNNRDDA